MDPPVRTSLFCGAVVTSGAHPRPENLPDLLHARPAIRARLAAVSDLREGAVTLANLLVELAIRNPFADAHDHGEGRLLELIIVFSS